MHYDVLEYSLSVGDWETVAAEMRTLVESVSLECFEKMLQEGSVSRSKWVVIFLSTGLHRESFKCEMMLKAILKQTWSDVGDDLRWPLISTILSFNDIKLGDKDDYFECISMAADFISEYIGVPRSDVIKVLECTDRVSVDLVIAGCQNIQ